MSRKTREKLRK